jgi:hypothetical protein
MKLVVNYRCEVDFHFLHNKCHLLSINKNGLLLDM